MHMYVRDIKDLLIRDRIICGTCDSSLQEELLRKKHLTLKELIKEQEQLNCPGKGAEQWPLLQDTAESRREGREG